MAFFKSALLFDQRREKDELMFGFGNYRGIGFDEVTGLNDKIVVMVFATGIHLQAQQATVVIGQFFTELFFRPFFIVTGLAQQNDHMSGARNIVAQFNAFSQALPGLVLI